ncbi:hypothetical protein CTAYLR_001922 [Chrysophaeum taylorii]|uniref:rRNA methylase n=1 Tax=Chrysophaeum taylorii TaxID=2483200 RepID=A0AAD7XG94_9STRA|nr:hypothetical protein CTAYLR_001922 [Chrysophaeum taylorii]
MLLLLQVVRVLSVTTTAVRRSPLESHLHLAKALWRLIVRESDTVVDATCGRGRDTAELVRLAPRGRVVAMDTNAEAIEACRGLAVELYHQSHERPPDVDRARLVVFNLGYLPGAAVREPTRAETTLRALESWVLPILEEGGAASIMVYPGHSDGAREATALEVFARSLSNTAWRATEHRPVNHRREAPYLLTIFRVENSRKAPDDDDDDANLKFARTAALRALSPSAESIADSAEEENADEQPQKDDAEHPPPEDEDDDRQQESTRGGSAAREPGRDEGAFAEDPASDSTEEETSPVHHPQGEITNSAEQLDGASEPAANEDDPGPDELPTTDASTPPHHSGGFICARDADGNWVCGRSSSS